MCLYCHLILVSYHKQFFFFRSGSFSSGIDKLEEIFERDGIDITDADDACLSLFPLFHSTFEHGSKDGTRRRKEEAVGTQRFISNQEIDVSEMFFYCSSPQLISAQNVSDCVTVVWDRADHLDVKLEVERSGIDVRVGKCLKDGLVIRWRLRHPGWRIPIIFIVPVPGNEDFFYLKVHLTMITAFQRQCEILAVIVIILVKGFLNTSSEEFFALITEHFGRIRYTRTAEFI